MLDDDRTPVGTGDHVTFSYGIPPVEVVATISQQQGRLIGYCPGHNPPNFNLRSLRRHVGSWYKHYGARPAKGQQTRKDGPRIDSKAGKG